MALEIKTKEKNRFTEEEYKAAMILRLGEIVDGLGDISNQLTFMQAEIRRLNK